MLIDLYNRDGNVIEQVELNDAIFGVEPNEHAMHLAVVSYLAHQRQGTHKTKTKGEVSGGGKKPWRQKGRGTARAGSTRSPIWVGGGGTIHGPQPHKYSVNLPKKVKRLARKSAFTCRCEEKNIVLVQDFQLEEIKTKKFIEIMDNLKIKGEKTLVLIPETDERLYLSVRNIPNVSIYPANLVSTYDILNHKKLLIFKGSLETIEKTFSN